jgi:hypothetical protein
VPAPSGAASTPTHPDALQRRIGGPWPRTILSLLAAACTGACAPVVTHGPAVLGGTHVVGTAGAGVPPCDSPCDLALLPQGALGIHTGRPATGTRPGFQLGVNASVNLISSELDLYVQAPTRYTPLDVCAGVLLGGTHVMPYVQAGRMRARDGSTPPRAWCG